MFLFFAFLFSKQSCKSILWVLHQRSSKLSGPAQERRQQLEDSLKLQQFCRDVEDEMQWIKERKPLAESNDFGKSLMGVQNLQRKHQVGIHHV